MKPEKEWKLLWYASVPLYDWHYASQQFVRLLPGGQR